MEVDTNLVREKGTFFMWGQWRGEEKKRKKRGAGGDGGAGGAEARRSDARTRPADPSLNPAELSHRGTS